MAHGGTQNAVPPSEQRTMNNFCNSCGVTFDSSESLQVHIHNNHNQPVSAAADSSDNQPPTPQSTANGENNHQQALNHYNRHPQEFSGANTNLNQLPNYHQPSEMHYPSYMSNYDQFYHQHSMEYGLPPPIPTHYLNNTLPPSSQSQPEYKAVPSSNRFHPYGTISSNLPAHHPYSPHHAAHNTAAHSAQSNQSQNGPAIAAAAAISAAAAQSSMSPSVVTSSSPIQNNLMNSTTVPSSMANAQTTHSISGQPTPSPSPRQCDKCGVVCETISQLNEHQATAHNASNNSNDNSAINRNSGNGDIENDIPSFQYSNFGHVKEEAHPADCDILDLDSQKMVYPPHDLNQQGPLPPMHSLHPMPRSMMWPHGPPPHESNSFLPIPPNHNQSDLKPPMFGAIKNEFSPQIIKQEGPHHLTQLPSTPTNPPQSDISKSFGGSDGSQTSPSEFPSTTTPQDNGPQFRTFEAATSSLPNGAPMMKASAWKSNEARRPKTYNCTACNKWFTSSGHLKRHYNTTLHKNAVKSSGQPDPASLPISAHHHPARDPNSKHNRFNNNKTTHNNNSIVQQQSAQQVQPVQQQQQQSALPTESSRTPDYSSQFTAFAPQNQPPNPMAFQQYANPMQSNASIHPNAQAGLYGLSQPRDLLTYSDITGVHSNNHISHISHISQSVPNFIQAPQMQPILQLPESTTMQSITSMEPCNITTPITINTNITQSYQLMQRLEDQNYIIGNQMMHTGNSNDSTTTISYYGHEYDDRYDNYQPMSDDDKPIKCYSNTIPAIAALRRLNNDVHHADTVPPFSPDIPDKRISVPYNRSITPQTGEIVPTHLSPNAPSHQYNEDGLKNEASIGNEPSSPSITSTNSAIGFEHFANNNKDSNASANTKIRTKPNKRRSAVDTAKLITDTIPAGNDPLRCAPCDKVFNKACYLTQHNKTFHSGEKPFKCQRCGKRFPCDQSHTEHMAKHNGNKPFKCNQCVKQFNHKTDLRRHMCLHTGTKPYICEICNKGFIRKDHMVKHGLTHLKRKNGDAQAHTPTATAAVTVIKRPLSNDQLTSMDELEPGKQITNSSSIKAKKRNANSSNLKKKKLLIPVTTQP